MFCPHCGTANDDNSFRCTKCGQIIQAVAAPVRVRELADDPVARMLLPVGRSVLSIVAGYFGLFAFWIVPAPIALILGILAVVDLRQRPHLHGMGRAVFAIVTGGLGTALLVWLLLQERY